jgi:hypothetical protein
VAAGHTCLAKSQSPSGVRFWIGRLRIFTHSYLFFDHPVAVAGLFYGFRVLRNQISDGSEHGI